MANPRAYARRRASYYGLDPNAVLAVAQTEGGWNGAVGDSGSSYGPWQLHWQGAMPKQYWGDAEASSQFANSPEGIDYALRQMSQYAKGLTGKQAISAIVNRFERPADPTSEIAKALGYYGGGNPGAGPVTPFAGPQAATPVDDGSSNRKRALLGYLLDMDPSSLPALPAAQQVQTKRSRFKPGVPGSETGAVQAALTQLGVNYKWGGNSWREGKKGGALDCSSLIQGAYAKIGVKIPRVTYDQWKVGQAVGANDLRPGDAVFFNMGKRGPNHVGLYIGNGQFIEAPRTGLQVRISNLAGRTDFVGGRRYV